MRILSPAKINLHLRVGPPGADGYHPLLSWMCTAGLYDAIEMELRPDAGIRLTCDRADVPVDGRNLIVRAGEALGGGKLGAEVRLEKRIPMGGGLGGGSSNAAFALNGFNRLWNLNQPVDRLAEIGAKLGSDIVFFLHGANCVCSGRGEFARPIGRARAKFAVLFFPEISMGTPGVYRRFDEMKLGNPRDIEREPDWAAWGKLPAVELLRVLVNDLEGPAFSICPELGELRGRIEREIGRVVRMSGSGSTLFTLVDERLEGEGIAEAARGMGIGGKTVDLGPVLPMIE